MVYRNMCNWIITIPRRWSRSRSPKRWTLLQIVAMDRPRFYQFLTPWKRQVFTSNKSNRVKHLLYSTVKSTTDVQTSTFCLLIQLLRSCGFWNYVSACPCKGGTGRVLVLVVVLVSQQVWLRELSASLVNGLDLLGIATLPWHAGFSLRWLQLMFLS
jgi:hypothetical protein